MDTVVYVVRFVGEMAVRFAPVFFLSIALAAVVKALPIAQVASRWLARREHASIAAGSLLGTFSPFCSCTVVPVVRSLLVAGAPLAGVMAFWVASPLMDPEIFVMSVALLGWDIAVARVLAALALSLLAGFGAVVAVRRGWLSDSSPRAADCDSGCGTATAPAATHSATVAGSVAGEAALGQSADAAGNTSHGTGATAVATLSVTTIDRGARRDVTDGCCDAPASVGADDATGTASVADVGGTGLGAVAAAGGGGGGVVATLRGLDWHKVRADVLAESWHIGRWILLAFALEALILRFVPQESLIAVLGSDAPWAVPLAALLGVPLYMDSLSALPVIAGLLEQGMAPGAAIAFLLAGPVTTIPAMTAVRAVLPGPVFRYYLAVSLFGSILLGLAVDLVL